MIIRFGGFTERRNLLYKSGYCGTNGLAPCQPCELGRSSVYGTTSCSCFAGSYGDKGMSLCYKSEPDSNRNRVHRIPFTSLMMGIVRAALVCAAQKHFVVRVDITERIMVTL